MNINKWGSAVSLNSEIRAMEQRLHQRQLLFSLQTDAFKHCLREKISSPKMILIAAGAGFAIGYFSLRRHSEPTEGTISKISSLIFSLTNILMMTGSVMAFFQHKGVVPNADTTNQDH
jgi:hypothetical protein